MRSFSFRTYCAYDTNQTGITIPVELSYGDNTVQIDAKLDTGASFCIFERSYGEMLGVEIESGIPERVSTANGVFQVFGHRLKVGGLECEFESLIYFAADERIRRNVLGRRGFIDQFRLCLIEHDGQVYVSRYDDDNDE